MPKLSIIVPVYNVAQYLRKCVDSLLAQDYEDYEIILVDDGSTDDSSQICEEYKQPNLNPSPSGRTLRNDISITVIHQPNGGLSAARNTGVKAAKGEYVCFVDSDDYWEPNVLGGLMAQVERDNLDVLRFKYQHVRVMNEGMSELGNEREYEVFNPYKSDPYRNDDYSAEVTDGVTFLNTRFGTACYAVMFIIKRSLIVKSEELREKSGELKTNHTSNITHQTSDVNNILFTPGIYFEDTDWTPRMLIRAKRVASTDTVVYNYLVREGSITNAVNRSKQKKVLDDKMRLIGALKEQENALREQGQEYSWFARMISATVVSIIGILSVQFYAERKTYLAQLKKMNVYPIAETSAKARLINISPWLMIEFLHLKN